MKSPKSVFLLITTFFCLSGNAQEEVKDTLFSKSYEDLNALFYTWLPKDTLIAKTIAHTYVEKGRMANDTIRMARGYHYYATAFSHKTGLEYADKIIDLTKSSRDQSYPAFGYLLKGYWYYQLKDFPRSLEYYLEGNRYAEERNNLKLQIGIRQAISVLKTTSGDYKGALEIDKEHLNALENDLEYKELYSKDTILGDQYISDHIMALYNLSLSYLHLRETDSSRIYINKGASECLKHKETLKYYEFVSSGGALEYYDDNFKAALDSLDKAIPHLTNEYKYTMAHYYKGKCYEALGRNTEALSIFLKTDSLAEKINYKFPELRQAYEYLIDHYNVKQEIDSQLVYINKVMELDKELIEVSAMDGEIVRKYDTPQLIRKKETLIEGLEQKDKRNTFYKWLLLAAVILLGIILIYNYRKRKTYQKRYRELLSQNNTETETLPEVSSQEREDSGVPEDLFKEIEKGLAKFEENQKFTEPDITLNSLAKKLNTNSTYLSRVINTTKGVNFSNYLHHLRISSMVRRLKEDEKLRTYVIEAIAEEAGYKTAQSFTRAFYRQTGIYPSYFLKKLKEEKKQLIQ